MRAGTHPHPLQGETGMKALISWEAAILWLALLVFDTGSQLAFKLGADGLGDVPFGLDWLIRCVTSPWVLGAIACYAGAFLTWLLILRQNDLSRAFPLSALGYVTVLGASALLLGEHVDLTRWTGAGVIMLGVVVLGGDE